MAPHLLLELVQFSQVLEVISGCSELEMDRVADESSHVDGSNRNRDSLSIQANRVSDSLRLCLGDFELPGLWIELG